MSFNSERTEIHIMKRLCILISIILVAVTLLFTGCASKQPEAEKPSEAAQGTALLPEEGQTEIRKKADEIIAHYTDIAGNALGDNTNAEAAQLITDCGDRLYEYADAVLEAVLKDVSARYEEHGGELLTNENDTVSAIKEYALSYRNIYDNTAKNSYQGITDYVMSGGSGGSTFFAQYRFDCGRDYFNKMIDLAEKTVGFDESVILEALESPEKDK